MAGYGWELSKKSSHGVNVTRMMDRFTDYESALKDGGLDAALIELYGTPGLTVQRQRYAGLIETMAAQFSPDAAVMIIAPGPHRAGRQSHGPQPRPGACRSRTPGLCGHGRAGQRHAGHCPFLRFPGADPCGSVGPCTPAGRKGAIRGAGSRRCRGPG